MHFLLRQGSIELKTAAGLSAGAPGFASSTGSVIFYGAFIGANGDLSNSGDTYHAATYTINEASTSTNNISSENQVIFNSITKTIETNASVSVYDINGKLVLSTDKRITNISHLKTGVYLLRSENKTQKIILN